MFSSVKACLTTLLFTCVLVLLTSHQMPYKIIGRGTFCCLCLFLFFFFEVEPLTSTSLSPLSSPLTLLPSPSWWLSNQIHLAPSIGQSHHIQTRGRCEEGDRRRRDHLWDISLSDRRPSWSITRKAMKSLDLLPHTWAGYYVSYLSWILFMTASSWEIMMD